MPADPCPAAACFNDGRVIHIQGNHSRPSCWGQANKIGAILAPAEVFAPELLTRMEQMYAPPCQRVFGLYLRALEFVTGMVGHAQVFPHRRPPAASGMIWSITRCAPVMEVKV